MWSSKLWVSVCQSDHCCIYSLVMASASPFHCYIISVVMRCADMVLKIWRLYVFSPETLAPLASIYCSQLPLHTSVGNHRLAVALQDPATATFCVVVYQLQTKGNLSLWLCNRSLYCLILFCHSNHSVVQISLHVQLLSVCWHYSRVPTDLESHGINLVREIQGFCWWSGKNDVYRLSCVIVVYFCCKNENTHSVHVITKWWWKGVSVGEEGLTSIYIQELIIEMRNPNVTWRSILPVYLFTTELRHTCIVTIFK